MYKINPNHLHIVSLDVPYPADYGGVIDIFYKLKALKDLGVMIHLHCFDYGRGVQNMLLEFCESVNYYKRFSGLWYFFKLKPYIVATRSNKQLLTNLLADDYPILFEGLHSCYFLSSPELKNRTKLVRAHNVEHQYYTYLSRLERNPMSFRKIFFWLEALKLNRFEKVLNHANSVLAISPLDYQYFASKSANSTLIPAFHPYSQLECKPGRGNFALYHGNLSVGENIGAAIFLITQVFVNLNYTLVIAGKNPDKRILKAAQNLSNIKIVANPNQQQMSSLLQEAHINILPTSQSTGIKLKLLAALFAGKHCIANSLMVENTNLETLLWSIVKEDQL